MIRKVLSGIINGFFVVAFLCIVAVATLMIMGYRPYIVKSGSMEPVIKTGSLVFVDSKYDYDAIEVKDIVAFQANDETLVTHRVIGKENGMLETKGDNNDVSDGLTVSKENFKGLSKFWIPQLGFFLAWLQTAKGRILAITFFVSLILIDWIINSSLEDSKKEEETNEIKEDKEETVEVSK